MLGLITFIFAIAVSSSFAQQNQVKGQNQLAGGAAQFGVVYSLKNGFNLAVLGARYTLEPYNAYTYLLADSDKKNLVLDLAVKNATSQDAFFSIDGMFTLIDDAGQTYTGGSLMLESRANDSSSATLRPGQGLGQAALKDPLHIAFQVPNKAKIVKVMLNVGRLNTSEDVIRFNLVAPPKPGTEAANKTFIAPLPENARDASDPLGALPLAEGKGGYGIYLPSGGFLLKANELTTPGDAKFGDNAPEDGKKFVVVSFTAKSMLNADQSMFDVEGGDEPLYKLVDADGETYHPTGFRKMKADEDPDHTFKLGDEYSYRVFFTLPKDSKPVKLVYGAHNSHVWSIGL